MTEPDPWHEALSNLIYMLFLAYESARKAIEGLIEFQPTRVECTIVMLLTELKCYPLLLQALSHIPRGERCPLLAAQAAREVL